MNERRKSEKYIQPTEHEIAEYMKMVSRRKPFDDGDDISEGVDNVRLVSARGVFLGWGQIGRYDWFTLIMKKDGKNSSGPKLHYENASNGHNMAMLSEELYISDGKIEEILL